MLAAYLNIKISAEELPRKIGFRDTLARCREQNIISEADARDLQKLAELRNPLSHHRHMDDPANLSRRVIDERIAGEEHLRRDATFAISMAVRLLALPVFRVGD